MTETAKTDYVVIFNASPTTNSLFLHETLLLNLNIIGVTRGIVDVSTQAGRDATKAFDELGIPYDTIVSPLLDPQVEAHIREALVESGDELLPPIAPPEVIQAAQDAIVAAGGAILTPQEALGAADGLIFAPGRDQIAQTTVSNGWVLLNPPQVHQGTSELDIEVLSRFLELHYHAFNNANYNVDAFMLAPAEIGLVALREDSPIPSAYLRSVLGSPRREDGQGNTTNIESDDSDRQLA